MQKEERASLEQFTHSDRRVSDCKIEDISDVTSSHQERFEAIEDWQERGTKQPRIEEVQERITAKQERIESRSDRLTGRQERAEEKQERVTSRQEEREKVTGRQEKIEKGENKRTEDRRERTERMEKREDRKTVRQSSVKSLTEKYIKSASKFI